jgi:hypothetical protein
LGLSFEFLSSDEVILSKVTKMFLKAGHFFGDFSKPFGIKAGNNTSVLPPFCVKKLDISD